MEGVLHDPYIRSFLSDPWKYSFASLLTDYAHRFYDDAFLQQLRQKDPLKFTQLYCQYFKIHNGTLGAKHMEDFLYFWNQYGIQPIETNAFGVVVYGSGHYGKIRHDFNKWDMVLSRNLVKKLPKYTGKAYRWLGFETREELDGFLQNLNGMKNDTVWNFTANVHIGRKFASIKPYSVLIEVDSQSGHYLEGRLQDIEHHVWFDSETQFRVKSIDYSSHPVRVILQDI